MTRVFTVLALVVIPLIILLTQPPLFVLATQGLHSPMWEPVFSDTTGLGRVTNSSSIGTGGAGGGNTAANISRYEALVQVASGTVPYFVDALPLSSTTSSDENSLNAFQRRNIKQIHFADASLCVAFHIGAAFSLELSLQELTWILQGNSSALPFISLGQGGAISTENLTVVLPSDSASQLINVVSNAVSSSSSSTTLLLNSTTLLASNTSHLVFEPSEADVVRRVSISNMTIALASQIASVRAGLPCAQLSVPHPVYPSVDVALTPSDTKGSITTENDILRTGGALYPLTVPCYIFASVPFSCVGDRITTVNEVFHQLVVLVEPSTATSLRLWGIAAVDFGSQVQLLTESFSNSALDLGEVGLCGAASVIPSGGSSAIAPLAEAWSILYLHEQKALSGDLVLLDYPGGGSSTGIREVKANNFQLGGTDSLLSAEEYAQFPELQMLPVTSFPVSVIVNIPGASSLTLPRCVLVGIFSGEIEYWNHPQIVVQNPSVLLPQAKIVVVARSTRSGTTGIFTGGLEALYQNCVSAAATASSGATSTSSKNIVQLSVPVSKTSTWDLTPSGLVLETTTSGVVDRVVTTSYSIGYASAGAARSKNTVEVSLLDESSQATAAPTSAAVSSALLQAKLNGERLVLDFVTSATAYPFVGVTYFLYHRTQSGNCSRMRQALDLVRWSGINSLAKSTAEDLHYVPIPQSLFALVEAKIEEESICDGSLVFPKPPSSEQTVELMSLVPSVLVLLLITGIIVAFCITKWARGKAARRAPKDESQDVTVIFVSVYRITELWDLFPEELPLVLKELRQVIRRCSDKHKVYEVKRVGDGAFMLACSNPETALQFSANVQRDAVRLDRSSNEEDHDDRESVSNRQKKTSVGKTGDSRYSMTINDEATHNDDDCSEDETIFFSTTIGIQTGKVRIMHDEDADTYDYSGPAVQQAATLIDLARTWQVYVGDGVYRALETSGNDPNTNLAHLCCHDGMGNIIDPPAETDPLDEHISQNENEVTTSISSRTPTIDIYILEVPGMPYNAYVPAVTGSVDTDQEQGATVGGGRAVGGGNILAALEEANAGLAYKRSVTVLWIKVYGLTRVMNPKSKEEMVDAFTLLHDVVESQVHRQRGFLHSASASSFMITFNAASTVAHQSKRALACFFDIKHDLAATVPDIDLCGGLVNGSALVGHMKHHSQAKEVSSGKKQQQQQQSSKIGTRVCISHIVPQAEALAHLCRSYDGVNLFAPFSMRDELSTMATLQHTDLVKLPTCERTPLQVVVQTQEKNSSSTKDKAKRRRRRSTKLAEGDDTSSNKSSSRKAGSERARGDTSDGSSKLYDSDGGSLSDSDPSSKLQGFRSNAAHFSTSSLPQGHHIITAVMEQKDPSALANNSHFSDSEWMYDLQGTADSNPYNLSNKAFESIAARDLTMCEGYISQKKDAIQKAVAEQQQQQSGTFTASSSTQLDVSGTPNNKHRQNHQAALEHIGFQKISSIVNHVKRVLEKKEEERQQQANISNSGSSNSSSHMLSSPKEQSPPLSGLVFPPTSPPQPPPLLTPPVKEDTDGKEIKTSNGRSAPMVTLHQPEVEHLGDGTSILQRQPSRGNNRRRSISNSAPRAQPGVGKALQTYNPGLHRFYDDAFGTA